MQVVKSWMLMLHGGLWWAYSPGGEVMPAIKVDIAGQIKKTIQRIE
jgi:hypothetical protein